MHTLKVIAGGLVLLAACIFASRWLGGARPASLAAGAKLFLPLWLVAAGVNMWLGVSRAGYSLAEEAPVFLVVFGVPAAVWWRFAGSYTRDTPSFRRMPWSARRRSPNPPRIAAGRFG